jgi:hypothetical protein
MIKYGQKPSARPLFRRLAFYVSMVCFLVAGIFVVFQPGGEGNWVGVVSCLFVGFVMLTIGKTGTWPATKHRH